MTEIGRVCRPRHCRPTETAWTAHEELACVGVRIIVSRHALHTLTQSIAEMGSPTPPGAESAQGSALSYRVARKEDSPLLREMRIECGWGLEKLEKRLGNPDWIFCIFTKVIDGEAKDVGMGGWCMASPYDGALPDEENLASREDKIVYLSECPEGRLYIRRANIHDIASLFIRNKYQRLGFGAAAMDLLEDVARDVYGAHYVTLDTTRYHNEQGPHGTFFEDWTRDSHKVAWYKSRGYTEFRVSATI